MLNKFKIAKNLIFLLLIFTLISNFIFWRFPEFYISFKTGYKSELIRNFQDYAHGKFSFFQNEYNKACENFNSTAVVNAYIEIEKISLTLIEISFFSIIIFFFMLKFDKNNPITKSKHFILDFVIFFVILGVSLIIYSTAYLSEIELDFLKACKGAITNGYLF